MTNGACGLLPPSDSSLSGSDRVELLRFRDERDHDDIGMDFEEEPADLLEDSAARADSSKRNREDEPKYD